MGPLLAKSPRPLEIASPTLVIKIMALSKLIQRVCNDIQVIKSGLKTNREQRTQPSLKWITEGQISEMKIMRGQSFAISNCSPLQPYASGNPTFFCFFVP